MLQVSLRSHRQALQAKALESRGLKSGATIFLGKEDAFHNLAENRHLLELLLAFHSFNEQVLLAYLLTYPSGHVAHLLLQIFSLVHVKMNASVPTVNGTARK